MKFDRTKNSSKIFSFGLIYNILTMILPFATRTIIIYKLGTEYLGLSSLFTSVLSMLNMANLGFGSAVAFCLYRPVAEDDKDTICALLSVLRKWYNIIGTVIFALGVIATPFLKNFISGSYPEDINIYILYYIYLLNTVVSYWLFSYKNVVLEVYQRGDIIYKIDSVVEVAKYAIQIAILLFFADYYIYALMLPIAQIAINISVNHYSKKIFPWCVPKGKLKDEYRSVIRQKVVYLSLHSITGTFTNSIDNIVISASIGLTAVALYGNYSYISSAIMAILGIAFKAVKSSIGNIVVSESKEYNLKIFNGVFFMCTWMCAWCSICLLCLYQSFIGDIWLGEDYLLSIGTVVMICLYFYANGLRQFLTSTYINVSGLWNKTLPRQIVATVSNLVLDLILVKPYGVAGIVFSSFFTYAVIALPMDVYVVYKSVFELPVITGFRKLLTNFGSLILLAGLTYAVCNFVEIGGILGFIVRLIICAVLPNGVMFLVMRNTEEFHFVLDHVKILVPRLHK